MGFKAQMNRDTGGSLGIVQFRRCPKIVSSRYRVVDNFFFFFFLNIREKLNNTLFIKNFSIKFLS